MDYTNSRSMKLLHLLGLADTYRRQPDAVSETTEFTSVFVTGFRPKEEGDKELGSWRVESVVEQKAESRRVNDGSFPAEHGQRCSQVVFENWMRDVFGKIDSVDFRVGWEYTGHGEDGKGGQVRAFFNDENGQKREIVGAYLVGCDGGRSRVREAAGIPYRPPYGSNNEHNSPTRFYLVDFRSAQLAQSRPFGRFWHVFPVGNGFIIDQDDQDTFTAHYIAIDSILVHGRWQPSFRIVDSYISDGGRVLLAGDAAHRTPPPGGYGMNSGIVDAFDLGWRFAAMVKGYGGPLLLTSYSLERRRSMIQALLRSHRHVMEHLGLEELCAKNEHLLKSDTVEGKADFGLELDLRYDFSPCVVPDGSPALLWDVNRYAPSTRPGSRAPRVILKGREHVGRIWERSLVLVRPDAHVVWRGNKAPESWEARQIVMVASGRTTAPGYQKPTSNEDEERFTKTMAAFGIKSSDGERAFQL
ncbi:hypothetical protein BJY01DRAFT_232846 [Aspergillus pseudoustus]|uniref:FAD-binding domain-containing protein n=1 Tax=Aspergillus pseudoustus TaxID=1810923 RepID=A0ABR4KH77_9EURO